jgi:7-keto-8-aminopelargonate synthetase-like enzyme
MDNYPDAALLVDDAHGVGVLGETGKGTYEHCGLWAASINASPSSKMLLCATLSKAMGGYGGIIPAGDRMLKALEECPLYNGASPAPSAITAGSAAALQILCGDKKPIKRLAENATLARKLLKDRGFQVEDYPTPIIWLVIGDAEKMKDIQEKVWEQGVAIDYVPCYSGVSEEGGIRIAVSSAHTNEHIEQLASAMARAM